MFYYKSYKPGIKFLHCRLSNAIKIFLVSLIISLTIAAQELPVSNSPAESPTPAATITPVPFSDFISQTDSTNSTLKEIGSNTSDNQTADILERDLPILTDEINARLEETAQIIASRTSLEKLRTFENDWRSLAKILPKWKSDLSERAKKLENNYAQLTELEKKWRTTESELSKSELPPEVSTRLSNIFSAVSDLRRQIEIQKSRIVGLQDKVAEQQKRAETAIFSLKQTRELLVGQLLVQDSPAIWNSQLWSQSQAGIWNFFKESLNTQFNGLADFVVRNHLKIITHFILLIIFSGILILLRQKADERVQKDENLRKAAVIFYLPISTALILTILFSSWIYPQTPQILSAILGAVSLIPTILILRKLVERTLYPILYSLVIFYLIDQLRTITDSQIIISRLLFLIEMLGGFVFFVWLLRSQLKKNITEKVLQSPVYHTFRFTVLCALPIFAVAFLANLFGYVALSQLLGNAVLRSTYTALILYALIRILDGLIIFALRFPPLSLLKMVKNHRQLIQKKVRRFLRLIALLLWGLITLELLSLREPLFSLLKYIFTSKLNVGSLNVSLGDISLFIITVWGAFLFSRFIRFVMDEDVYPRVSLERGLPYAISTLLKYAILLIGFFLAVAAAGFDMSKFTILAGAFGVGIGFGLQNIINNFVSGIILLFERPVKVGDIIKIDDAKGTVKRIGIRASVIHVWDNSDIIVPNSKLISENVTNWTFSSQQRGIEIIFSVPPETVPSKIIKIMEDAAENHPLVTDNPTPQVLFDRITFEELIFKLRVWTEYFDKTNKISSDLVLKISESLSAENIPHKKSPTDDLPAV